MTPEFDSFLYRFASVPADGSDRIVIFPPGVVELFGDDDILMDEEAARDTIASFENRNVKVPVDYEHSTRHKAGKGEPSPAAGWITAMAWSPTDGLVGTVEWSEKAKDQIKKGEYKYLSPHFRLDTDTRRVDHVLAVALTNTPRINNMRELVAASLAAADDTPSDGGHEMKKEHRTKLCSVLKLEDGATDEEIIAQAEEAVETPAEPSAEERAAMAAKDTLIALQSTLMEAGILGPESTLADAAQAALDLVGKTANTDGDEDMEEVASALGLEGDTSKETIIATINERTAKTVPVDEVKKLREEVASLTSERDERRATEIVGSLVEDGKINPHDEKNMTWARNLAKSDPDQLASLMEDAPALYKSGRETPGDPASKTKRETVIASALQDHKHEGVKGSPRHYVNVALDEEGMEHLNDDEAKKHSIA